MSLLLDALKKAASDKEKLSRDNAIKQDEAVEKSGLQPVLHSKSIESQQSITEHFIDDETTSTEGYEFEPLTLDSEKKSNSELFLAQDDTTKSVTNYSVENKVILSVVDVPEIEATTTDSVSTNSVIENSETESSNHEKFNQKNDNSQKLSHGVVGDITISDEGLSLLIDKTNRGEKQRKITIVVSVIFVSMMILSSGGLYYYTDMQSEIESLERKHQIAMQRMRSKTNRETPPEKTEIIRNLVSDVKLEEKVEFAKAKMASEKKLVSINKQNQFEFNQDKENKTKASGSAAVKNLTITKTKKADQVGKNLDAGWLAYEDGRYNEAKRLYSDVLKAEKSNRDAQLGLAAIAVIEKDNAQARRIYLLLLEQDPRDPIATAALVSLNSNKASLKKDKEYLLAMLEKNPDEPSLNFSIGNKYAQQKQWKSAQQYYFKAWQYDSENADYLFNLAVSMDQLGKAQQAINFYRDTLEKSKNKQVGFSVSAVQKRIDELSEL